MPEAQLYNFCLAPAVSAGAQIVRQIVTHADAFGGTNATTTRSVLSTSLTVTPKSTTSTLLVHLTTRLRVTNTVADNELGAMAYPGFDDGSGWNNAPFSGAVFAEKYATSQINEISTGGSFIGVLDQSNLNGSGDWVVALLGEALAGKNSSVESTSVYIACTEFEASA